LLRILAAIMLPDMRILPLLSLCVCASTARAEPDIRILLQSDAQDVRIEGRALRYAVDHGPVVSTSAGVLRIRVRGQGLSVDGRARGRRVVVEGDGALRVGNGQYLGRVEVVAPQGTVVNRLPIETYLLGIVGSEMPASWPAAALEAQAVAARTYALDRRLRRRSGGHDWDLHDSVLSQVYKGAASIQPSVVSAVKNTRGVVLAFRHVPAEALFHSTCGGRTRSAQEVFGGEVPYLVRRPCRWCRDSERYRWSLRVPLSDLAGLLARAELGKGRLRRVERRSDADVVTVRGSRGERTLPPRQLRAALGFNRMYSGDFTARTRGHTVEVRGRGFGHQVGLCQWGARGMAEEGRDFRTILAHYYPSVPLKRAY
jgi:stage II sporulation protein D